jgi:dihydroflavonol-4-reductase
MDQHTLAGHTFLITGATGFVGSHLAKELCSRGLEVHILRRKDSSTRLLDSLPVHHHTGDILDNESVANAMRGCTAVFHCAGIVSFWRKQRKIQYDVNVHGTEIVATTALASGILRFVHTSSIAALGPTKNGTVTTEDSPFGWDTFDIGYNISKYEAELRIIGNVKKGLNAVIVNPSTIVGPGDIHMHGSAVISNVVRSRLPYYIETPMNLVDIDDVVRGHLLAFEKGKTGERYILSGHSLPLGELLLRIEHIGGGRAPRRKIPYAVAQAAAAVIENIATIINIKPPITKELLRVGKQRREFSCEKAERELGYTRTPLDETIRKTAEWLKAVTSNE